MPGKFKVKLRYLLLGALGVCLLFLAWVALSIRANVRAGLAITEGEASLVGLRAPAAIARDSLGTPSIRADSRLDAMRALGFVHAQERFFQMDLQRRSAAGSLAELFPQGLAADRELRRFDFQGRAERRLKTLPLPQKQLLQAYSEGVNAGIKALKKPPFEYQYFIRLDPEPWKPVDCLLVAYLMYLDLEDGTGMRAKAAHDAALLLPASVSQFLLKHPSRFTSLMAGEPPPLPALPASEEFVYLNEPASAVKPDSEVLPSENPPGGSNAWALAADSTASGRAMIANDPHLGLRVPNLWMRAAIHYPRSGSDVSLYGVTLPGFPGVIIGTNTYVSWGFTTSGADTVDLVRLEAPEEAEAVDGEGGDTFALPDGTARPEIRTSEMTVRGQEEPAVVEYAETPWGPIIGKDARGRPLALLWSALAPDAIDFSLLELDTARTAEAALGIFQSAGMPAHNVILADRAGNIAWTIAGNLVRREGMDSLRAASSADRGWSWEPTLPAEAYPVLLNPPGGRLWNANNRAVTGPLAKHLEGWDYSWHARAAVVEEGLASMQAATAETFLDLQYNIDGRQLRFWHELLLRLLDDEALRDDARREGLRARVVAWEGEAAVDSVGYQIIRWFRFHTQRGVMARLLQPLFEADADFRMGFLNTTAALHRILKEQPPFLVDPDYETWRSELLSYVDAVLADVEASGVPIEGHEYGRYNFLQMNHPLGQAIPLTGHWFNMPDRPMSGDSWTPKSQRPGYGPTLRFISSPGDEANAVLQLPGGVSGNPLSPYYRAGHADWISGDPTPLLPGEAETTLRLLPE